MKETERETQIETRERKAENETYRDKYRRYRREQGKRDRRTHIHIKGHLFREMKEKLFFILRKSPP